MKERTGALAIVFFALVAMLGTTTLAARPMPAYSVTVGQAKAGGAFLVTAKVRFTVPGTAFSASATAHLGTTPVTIALKRQGRSFVASGKVAVPADLAAGLYDVEVRILYGTGTYETTVQAAIR
jgi:hypothetical protein